MPTLGGGVSAADRAAVQGQLGYVPTNLLAVAARAPPARAARSAGAAGAAAPTVLLAYPLVRERATLEPFPTMFWRACPALHRDVSTLERDGGVRRLMDRLEADAGARARMARAHEAYAARRWGLLTRADRGLVAERG